MVITTSRVSEEQTDYTWGEAIVTSDMELNNVYDETINKEETPLNSNNEVTKNVATNFATSMRQIANMYMRTNNLYFLQIELEEHWDIDLLSFLRGGLGVTPYRDRDITNYRGKISRETCENDMMQALMYFTKKKAQDPSFYYMFLVDSNHKVKCIFWTDPRSIRYYQRFGDCVSFDTTYLTNKYRMPFAPFAGITGHGLTCVFGCALISDETIDTFKWFKTFLEAMGGKN